jgi:2-polyprenyl-3-methyl-5-hydroxy-6-metoxy-1,4-benzoquinol methylase
MTVNCDFKCILCQSADVKTLVPAHALPDRVGVLKCHACQLVFLEPRSVGADLDPEEAVYWDDEEQKKIYLSEEVQDVFQAEFDHRLSTLEDLRPKKGRLLDVGCGVGHFLASANMQGWLVQGLDISNIAREAARESYNLDVLVGTLDSTQFQHDGFDVITLWDVIEHIRKPVENLKAANQALQMGGLLVLKTPNESSFFKWVARTLFWLLGRRGAFLLKYVYYVPHYFSYSKRSMNELLKRCGFEVVRYEMDETPQEFAEEKINVHYKKDPKRSHVIKFLPMARRIARLVGRSNKMVVYARKVKAVEQNLEAVA